MNLPTLTPELAKELRALRRTLKSGEYNGGDLMRAWIRLEEYARLIDTVLDGGDVVTDDVCMAACDAYDETALKGTEYPQFNSMRAALTAALPAIRMRLLADIAKEGK